MLMVSRLEKPADGEEGWRKPAPVLGGSVAALIQHVMLQPAGRNQRRFIVSELSNAATVKLSHEEICELYSQDGFPAVGERIRAGEDMAQFA